MIQDMDRRGINNIPYMLSEVPYACIEVSANKTVTVPSGTADRFLVYDRDIVENNIGVTKSTDINTGWSITIKESGLYLISAYIEITKVATPAAFALSISNKSVEGTTVDTEGYGNINYISRLQIEYL